MEAPFLMLLDQNILKGTVMSLYMIHVYTMPCFRLGAFILLLLVTHVKQVPRTQNVDPSLQQLVLNLLYFSF
jgi:hypothetical protein